MGTATEEKKQELTAHYLLRNPAYKVSIPVSMVLSFVLLVASKLLLMGGEHTMRFCSAVQVFIVMMETSLSGYVAGAFVVLVFFVMESIATHSFVLNIYVLLFASLIANLPIVRQWYTSVWKSLLAALVFSVCIGWGWALIILMAEEGSVRWVFNKGYVLSSLMVTFCCYVYYNYVPQRVRSWFFTNSYMTREYTMLRKWNSCRKRAKIGNKIILAIVCEAVLLLLAAAVFENKMHHAYFGLASQSDTIRFTTQFMLLLTGVAIPIILAVVAYTNLNIANPLMLMAKAVEDSIMEDTCECEFSLDLRSLNIKTGDEISTLYDSLVKSLDATDNYIARLEREKELEKDLAVATEASKAKSEFLSNMSHEIRTPINAVLGLDEMILRESHEEDTLRYAHDIKSAGKSLLSLVNDILDFSKIEAGKMEIIPVEYDLGSVVNDLVNMTAKRAEEKGLELKIYIDEKMPHLLFGDEIRIKQCVLNILTNAIKYTQKGSVELNVSCEKSDGDTIFLCVHIVDTGIGIKKEDLPALYKAFERIEEQRNRTIEGTGLGLSIVQQLLALMGSRLNVESEYGKGSDFWFTVPQKVINWEPLGNYTAAYRSALDDAEVYVERFHAPGASVLVVDDTPLNLTVMRGLLKQTQVAVDVVQSGAGMLQLVTQKRYDIIFLDHRMPGMDGIETLEASRTLEGNRNLDTPCIALTANAVSGSREMYLDAGFTDYLSKPINSTKLEQMMLQYLPAQKVTLVEPGTGQQPVVEEMPELEGIEGICAREALRGCGSKELCLEVLREFAASVATKSGEMEQYAAAGDLKNLTVLVHALKSSARLIGASELSSRAAEIEALGDAGDTERVAQKLPALLSLYRSYEQRLAPLAPKPQPTQAMSAPQCVQALRSIRECMQAFDVGTADQIVRMLDGYDIPAEYAALVDDVRKGVSAVDYGAVESLLQGI